VADPSNLLYINANKPQRRLNIEKIIMTAPTVSYSPDFRGLRVNASEHCKQGVYIEILKSIHDQLNALISYHSRISVIRFDLHFPDAQPVDAKLENSQVQHLLKMVKDNLRLARWGSHKRFVTGAVREIGKTGKPHYHIFIAFKSTYRRFGAFRSENHSGVWGLIQTRWKRLTGGSVYFCSPRTVERRDDDAIADCFYHLSYLAKLRDKAFGTGEPHKRFFFTRLKPKCPLMN
jgi:hypothetical protein